MATLFPPLREVELYVLFQEPVNESGCDDGAEDSLARVFTPLE